MAVELSPADPGPLPLELLLRSSGSDGPVRPSPYGQPVRAGDLASLRVAVDAAAILEGLPRRAAGRRWAAVAFAREVEGIRRHLAPISEPGVLLSSFGREAVHLRTAVAAGAAPATPIRVAYAIRWIELVTGLRLPDWSTWMESC